MSWRVVGIEGEGEGEGFLVSTVPTLPLLLFRLSLFFLQSFVLQVSPASPENTRVTSTNCHTHHPFKGTPTSHPAGITMMTTLDVHQRRLSGRITVLGTFLLLVLLLLSSTSAQSTSPPTTSRGEYATANNIFYVQGGSLTFSHSQLTSGMFSLDLTAPWNDQSPPWKAVPSAGAGVPPTPIQQSMAPSGDNSQLIIWNVEGWQITNFQISNNAWGVAYTYSTSNVNWGGLKVVVPPTATGVLGVAYMVKLKEKKRPRRMERSFCCLLLPLR